MTLTQRLLSLMRLRPINRVQFQEIVRRWPCCCWTSLTGSDMRSNRTCTS